jgi:hypothetical protein
MHTLRTLAALSASTLLLLVPASAFASGSNGPTIIGATSAGALPTHPIGGPVGTPPKLPKPEIIGATAA